MILKSAFRQLRKNVFMNTLIIIQLAAVMTIMCVLVSMIESRMEYYLPFADEFNSKGFLCEFDGNVASEKEILNNLGEAKCEFTYYGYYAVNIDNDDVTMENENTYVPETDLLSERWIKAYTPRMQSGSWLNDIPKGDEYIHAVVTQDNALGLTTGDIITLSAFDGGTAKAKVIGVMENKQYVVGYSLFCQTDLANNMNFFDMYYTYNSQVENTWGLFIPKSEIENSSLYEGDFAVWGMGFVLCGGMSEKEISEVHNYLVADCSPMYTVSLEEINENSREYIYEQLYILLPIALCIFLLTLITTVSVISISVNSQLKNYAIFYICGAKWRDCSLISFIYSLIICIIAGIISLIAVGIIIYKSLTVIKLGFFEVMAMLASVLIYLILSAVIPFIITHRNKPKDILKKD